VLFVDVEPAVTEYLLAHESVEGDVAEFVMACKAVIISLHGML
jgi:hypothetical protein